jgi:hypothetical protein
MTARKSGTKMSEFDEMDLDEEELELLRDPDDLSPEDVFRMVTVNRNKMAKVSVKLEDEDGDEVDLADTIADLIVFMEDKMKEKEGNQITDQIFPLISQSVASALGRMIGINTTAFYLSIETTKQALMGSMCIAFLLLKYVQKHNLKIFTVEEPIEQWEIDEMERKSNANRVAMMAALAGHDPRAILEQLKEEGRITDEDLLDLVGKGNSNNDLDDDEDEDDTE